jgi:hypothetical protein
MPDRSTCRVVYTALRRRALTALLWPEADFSNNHT